MRFMRNLLNLFCFLGIGFDASQSVDRNFPVIEMQVISGYGTVEQAQQTKDGQEYEKIFQQYLEICNRAIEQNRNKFPYTEIWGARFPMPQTQKDATLQATVY